jgi:Fur family ferric uptake transcriptional regulator
MTNAYHAQPLLGLDLAGAITVLRERGLRLSASRRLVLEALFDAEGPVSAEHISTMVHLDLSSVYRNLETFERHGLVRHAHLGHGPGLYVLLTRGMQEYLFCEECGAVHALAPEELDPTRRGIAERFGYQARFTHFAIVGTCPACVRLHAETGKSRHQLQRGGRPVNEQPEQDESRSDESEHEHTCPHSHEHQHEDGTVHEHPHIEHQHEHVEHEHEHSHGDRVHSHPHVHEAGLEDQHSHDH